MLANKDRNIVRLQKEICKLQDGLKKQTQITEKVIGILMEALPGTYVFDLKQLNDQIELYKFIDELREEKTDE